MANRYGVTKRAVTALAKRESRWRRPALSEETAEMLAADFRSNVAERKYPNFPGIAPIFAFFARKLTPRLVVSRDVKKAWDLPSQPRRQR